MNILITGGTGFIGSHLCEHFTQSGHGVWVLTRNAKKNYQLPAAVELIESLETVNINRIDVVINLAGTAIDGGRWTTKRKTLLRSSRLTTTQKLVEWIRTRQHPLPLFISGSAIGYYGFRDSTPLDETQMAGTDFAATLCQDWEASANQASDNCERLVNLRTGVVLSAQRGALKKMLPAFKLGLGGKLGKGEQYFSWIHIDDMVALIQHIIIDRTINGAVNATAPQAVSNAEFTRTLANVLHRPAFLCVPAAVLKCLLGDMSNLLLNGQNVFPEKLINTNFSFNYQSIEDALNDLIKT